MKQEKVPIASPDGLGVIFPALKRNKLNFEFKTIAFAPDFLNCLPEGTKVGEKLQIAGVKADPSMPQGFRTDCALGQESTFILGVGKLLVFKA